jgi:hypothetical protein
MPPRHNPASSRPYHKFIVHIEREDGATSARGDTNDMSAVFAPLEMCIPRLLTRVIQRCVFLANRVKVVGLGGFGTIAEGTRQPEVTFVVGATFRQWNQVLNLHRHGGEFLRGQAIATAMLTHRRHATANLGRNLFPPRFRHRLSEGFSSSFGAALDTRAAPIKAKRVPFAPVVARIPCLRRSVVLLPLW